MLSSPPKNIPTGSFYLPPPAMPEEYIVKGDTITSYRNYYKLGKSHLANWGGKNKNRTEPVWYV
jgi:hypothetical protein